MQILTPVLLNDTADTVAGKIRADLTTYFAGKEQCEVGGTGTQIVLTMYRPRANDTIFGFSVQNGTCTGLTTVSSITGVSGSAFVYKQTTTAMTDDFKWVSSAFQIDPIGKQVLKAIHFTYYAPIGTETGLYISKTVDADDFERVATLPTSAIKRNQKFVLPISRYGLTDWMRVKLEGTGNIDIYNMTMEWRIVERLR